MEILISQFCKSTVVDGTSNIQLKLNTMNYEGNLQRSLNKM